MSILKNIHIVFSRFGSYCKAVTLLTTIFLMLGFTNQFQKIATPEYEVKAVFLFNFAQFVEWPAHAFQDANSPIVIGVLGTDPFGSYLDETIMDEKINGHPLIVQRFTQVNQVSDCHILFIHPSLISQLPGILKSLKGKGILTVSDGKNFALQGGMVRFRTENNKIKLRINLEAVKAENLTISSKLLRLAEIIESK